MSTLCERPGCSEVGAAEYGMVPEDLLFWIAPITESHSDDQNVLCLRHADAMTVPRGWTLDDRREAIPRLFMAGPFDSSASGSPPASRPKRMRSSRASEQLVIDGTGEIERPSTDSEPVPSPWEPSFDQADDLDGLLQVSTPLLARAFRGAERRTS